MSPYDAAFVNIELSKPTSIFGLRLWVVIGILLGSFIVLSLFLLSLCITSRRKRHNHHQKQQLPDKITIKTPISKEIHEIVHQPPPVPEIQVDIGKIEHRVVFSDKASSSDSRGAGSGCDTTSSGSVSVGPEVSHLGWGRWYTLRELEAATKGFCEENVIGEGGYGIVYSGILSDGTRVAVKNLLNNRGQAEKEFKVEVEAIGRARHKNLVRLLGYCVEGAHRMLVYEYVDNGNLDQWLHGDVGDVSPLTWEIRMNIILGTAKGLAYLHEGLEPKVVHRDVKSSNILLDQQWNSKVSDFGLAKLLCSERSYITTRVMGTFGYVAPEYACTGMLNEKSDVYSFGILIMEIISGRNPVDYSRPQGEVNLIDWLKTMVGDRKSEEVVDPKLPEMPASKVLKRVLLVAVRCVDPDATKRPKMGHVIHMLEADDLFVRDERRIGRDSSHSHSEENRGIVKLGDKQHLSEGDSDTSEGETVRKHHNPTKWR
ncbi:probable serine/threonine-protein kinase At1g01540 [Mangifera indica]|uniref:probable serine/threonine-protein kinase At1g01540 n=1 Tax=Mangifera indica TaxID=29780 RepID=UPI001CF94B25|nr:probable serine/threonine-protein kinase At1g01540 [Mangifera indica]